MTDPLKNIRALKLKENAIVADLGAGSGFYTIATAKIVSSGRVYAIEIQKDFLTTIKNKADENRLENIEYIWADVEKIGGTKLKDDLVDAAIVSNILFQVDEKNDFVKETHRILKKGGKVLLIDWEEGSSPVLTGGHKLISKDEAIRMYSEAGFMVETDIAPGDHHYGIIFSKK